MKSSIIAIVFCFFGFFLPSQPISDTAISDLSNQLEAYYQAYPNEKVYVQTDRTFFDPGEDIWFKVYLANGNNQTSDISQVVYVELIDPQGSSVQKHQLVALNGSAAGDFKLDPEAPGGLYTIKAWTQWMRNFGDDQIYKKEITVQALSLIHI